VLLILDGMNKDKRARGTMYELGIEIADDADCIQYIIIM